MKLCNDSDDLFRHHFGRPSKVEAQAPGRINLIGEHIDYLDGWVLPAAIDRHIFAAAADNGEDVVRVCSTGGGAKARSADFSLDQLNVAAIPTTAG